MNKFLKEVARRWPVAKGSLAEVRKPCVRPNCRACRSGRKHPAFIFGFRENGRQRCLYVPRELVPALKRAIENGRWLEEELSHMGRQLIEAYRQNRALRQAPCDKLTARACRGQGTGSLSNRAKRKSRA
jgi:hypothetical protein